MELKTLMKMVGPIIVLNLILPTADIVSDLLTAIKLYVGAYGYYASDSVLKQFQLCQNNPLKYCTTNISTSGEHQYQHAWCKESEDDGAYNCDGFRSPLFYNNWSADPRGISFNEDPISVDGISHGVVRHPKFATMLLGNTLDRYIKDQGGRCF